MFGEIVSNSVIRSRKSSESALQFGGTSRGGFLLSFHLPRNTLKDTPMFDKCLNHSTRVTYENRLGKFGPHWAP